MWLIFRNIVELAQSLDYLAQQSGIYGGFAHPVNHICLICTNLFRPSLPRYSVFINLTDLTL